MTVNGICCKVLRYGINVRCRPPFLRTSQGFTGFSVWVLEALEPDTQCLPVARMKIEGAFSKFQMEVAVSDKLFQKIPSSILNRSMRNLNDVGEELNVNPVVVVTRQNHLKKQKASAP